MFTAAWNQFIWPLLIMSKDSVKTLQVGLQVFQTQYTTTWDLLMAATVVLTVPVLVSFMSGQRYFTRGDYVEWDEGVGGRGTVLRAPAGVSAVLLDSFP
jgi:ABC-type glycerol-3-phosphate transport system permease component